MKKVFCPICYDEREIDEKRIVLPLCYSCLIEMRELDKKEVCIKAGENGRGK